MAVSLPRFHDPVHGGAEGLRFHLCAYHGEHRDEGTSQADLEAAHDDEHEYANRHPRTYTCPDFEHEPDDEPGEWDDEGAAEGLGPIHRGIGVELPDKLHKYVHDRRRRPADRAQALLDHVRRHPNGIGVHWTTTQNVAEDFGENSARGYAAGRKPGTSVVFHAAEPSREDIDHNIYSDPTVYGYHDHGEREVPLVSGENADLTGISWAPMHEDWDTPRDGEYTRHDFGNTGPHTAAQADDLIGHFEAAADDSLHLPDGSALAEGQDCPGCGRHITRYKGAWWNDDDSPHDCDDEGNGLQREAAARPGRDQKTCPCCGGSGEHGSRCDACGGSGFTGKDEKVEHCPGQPQPRRRHWRQASMPRPDYDPSDELPEGRGVFYRLHGNGQPLDEAHARSRPHPNGMPWYPAPGIQEKVGLRGYSAFASPHHLSQYMDEFGWIAHGHTRPDRAQVIAFHGKQVGRGDDNEPLVIPEANPHCCGNVIHSRMPFEEFEDRIWGENTPEQIPAKPWDSKYTYEGSPHARSVKRHYRQQTERVLREQRREAAMAGDMIDLYHHTYPETADTIRREKRFLSDDDEDRVYFTNAPGSASARDFANEDGEYGVVHVRMPRHLVNEWPGGVNSEGEAYYDADRTDIRPEHILGDDPVHENGAQHTAAVIPAAERTENVRHILDNYRPYDFDTWDEVRDNINWDDPSMREFVEDVRRNGVKHPIPVDYEQDPPQVRNGHTRLLAAERAGTETVPARQHEGFMDPDDPDHLGRGPEHPEHWTNKPEWQREAAVPAGDEHSGDYKDPRAAELLGHFEGAVNDGYRILHTAPTPEAGYKPLHYYHGGSPEDLVRIYRSAPAGTESINRGDWISLNPAYAHQHGYGEGPHGSDWPVYTAEVPQKHVHWDENDENEHGYNGPEISHPDVHDEETGELRGWDDWHEEHPHGREAWMGGAVHLPGPDHEFVHDEFGDEKDRADRLLAAAHDQDALHHGRWRDDLYDAREDAEQHASHVQVPEGHQLTGFTLHRGDAGNNADIGLLHRDENGSMRGHGFIDFEDSPYPRYTHQAIGEAGRQKEASVRKQGISGETAPEGHEIWAEPHGTSPVAAELLHNMRAREPEDHYRGISYHGPYHLIRHPQTRETYLVDREGRNASPYGRSFGNWQRDGLWAENAAQEHWHGLESAGPDAHRIGTKDQPSFAIMKERTPAFPHTRVDPEDAGRVTRPDARVLRPEGYSPSEEWHGPYEVVRHPETGKFHVVDNSGRNAPGSAIAWRGFETQLQAERSRDYTDHRQQSKERGRELAGKILGEETEEEREGRESERNLAEGENLMSRYEGGRGQIKFDEDEEGGQPYYERDHYLDNGKPSGWYVKHYGGTHADVYHRATGDRGHVMLPLTRHEMPDGSEHLSPAYGDEDLAADLKEWYDRPESERRYYEEDKHGRQNEPRIHRWKQRHIGSAQKEAAAGLIAHFEDGSPASRLDPKRGSGRQREGDERPYGGYTMRYRTQDLGERKPRHVIEAFHPDGSVIGRLNWYGTTGRVHRIEVASDTENEKTGNFGPFGNGQDHQNKGIATAMWDWSQEMTPKARHSGDQTDAGKAWVRSLRKPRREPPGITSEASAEEAAAEPAGRDDQPEKGARFFHGRTGTYPAAPGDLLAPQPGGMRHMYYTTHLPTAARAAAYGHPLNERGYQDLDAEALPGHVYEVVPETAAGRRTGRHAVDPDSGLPGAIQSWRTKGRLRVLHEVDRETGEPLEGAGHTAAVQGDPGAELLGHFEAAAEIPEYGPKPNPDWSIPANMDKDDPRRHELYEKWHGEERDWKSHIRRGLGLGHLTQDRARELGYHGSGHERSEPTAREYFEREGREPYESTGWQHLPGKLYHVTTDMPGVRQHGLKSRAELGQGSGHGLGGGEDDTISLTSSHELAQGLLRAMHEYHGVLNGRKTPQDMWEEAKAGTGAQKPFHRELARYHGGDWEEGDPLPRQLDAHMRGVELKQGGMVYSPQEMAEREGPGWRPHRDSGEITRKDGTKLYNVWERDASPDKLMHQRSDMYKNFSYWRSHAGGPQDPLFISNDVGAFARKNPADFGLLHVRPRPGAQGYPLSAQHEWRTTTGDALEVHRAEGRGGISTEAAMHALENPHTHGAEWYHGSPWKFGGFSGNEPYSPLHYEEDPENTSHWNTLLGHHFAASHETAEEFSRGEHSAGPDGAYDDEEPAKNVIHGRLNIRNPKAYKSEHDMDQDAYEHEWKAGNHHDNYHDPELLGTWEDGSEFKDDERPPTYQYAGHGDRLRSRDEADPRYWNLHRQFHPYATGWLNAHPDKAGIADRFKQRLQAQGHDGIVYGNEFEGEQIGKGDSHHMAAIPFAARQIDVTQRHAGEECVPAEAAARQWPGRDQPMLPGMETEASLDLLAHFEEPKTAAGPYYQQKLFHMQPDPARNPEGSGRHNPGDPQAHVRWRQEHEEGYVPPRETWEDPEKGNRDDEDRLRHPETGQYWCHACGEHHDGDAEEIENHETTQTDWDEEYPRLPDTLHRGLRLSDGAHLAEHGGEQAARAIMSHIGDFGTHWTPDEDQARHYAGIGTGTGHHGPDALQVVLHARKPLREHIETDPEILADQNVYGMGYHDDAEVPLRAGAPVRVTGISWRRESDASPNVHPDDGGWQHHAFPESSGHTAAAAGMPEVVAHFGGDEEHTAALEATGAGMDAADFAQHLVNGGGMDPDEARELQEVINHIKQKKGPGVPINERDATIMARSFRGRDRMEQAGFPISAHSKEMKYPRGFSIDIHHNHRLGLVPEVHDGEHSWYARIDHSEYPMGPRIEHTIRAPDHELPGAVRKFLDDPGIQREMVHQREEGRKVHEEIRAENEELQRSNPYWQQHEGALEAAGSSDGDRYVQCGQGHTHWGANGAAGLLIRYRGGDGQHRYLLQHRSPEVQHGDTWSIPGGALGYGESPEEGAQREAWEELGELPQDLAHHHTFTDDHGNWKYHTVVMDSPQRFVPPGAGEDMGWESQGHGWFTPGEMRSLPLHPGFAASWERVRKSGALAIEASDDYDDDDDDDYGEPYEPSWEPAGEERDENGYAWPLRHDPESEITEREPDAEPRCLTCSDTWGTEMRHFPELGHKQKAPYMEPPREGELREHLHHHHGLDSQTSDLHMSPRDQERWHDSEHRHKWNLPHQHDTMRGMPGEATWPAAFRLSDHTDFTGGQPVSPQRLERVLSDPQASRPFRPLAPSESSLQPREAAAEDAARELVAHFENSPEDMESHLREAHGYTGQDMADLREGAANDRAVQARMDLSHRGDHVTRDSGTSAHPHLPVRRDQPPVLHPDHLQVRIMEHRIKQGLPPRPTEEEKQAIDARNEESRQSRQREMEQREETRRQGRRQWLHDNGFADEHEHEQFMGQMDREHDDIAGHYSRSNREEYDEGGQWHNDDAILREHLASDHMIPNPDARAAAHEHGLGGLHWEHHVRNRENAHPEGLSGQWRPVPHTRSPDEQALMDAIGGDGQARGEGEPGNDAFRSRARPGDTPIDPVFGVRQGPAEHEAARELIGHFGEAGLEATAAGEAQNEHFRFFRGLDRDVPEPRTRELEEHLRSDHRHWADEHHIERAYSDAYNRETSDDPNNVRWRRYHTGLEDLHRRTHERQLGAAEEAEREHGAPAGSAEETRRGLEGAHRPYQEAEDEERREHEEAVAEHRENGSVRMHGNTVDFGEMESHLREAHGFPHDALPEYRLPTYQHGHDPYEADLEEAHNLAHGEMGSYRHDDEIDPDARAHMHGQPLSAWEADEHLVNHHGFDIDDLRRDEPSYNDLERQHAENHERDRNFLTHHLADEMDEEGHVPHHEWGEHDEDLYQNTGQIPGYRHQQAQLGEYRHNPDYGPLDAPGEEPAHDTAFSYRHQQYMAPPRSHQELWDHMRDVHGITQSADSTKAPGQGFLVGLHDKFHAGEQQDRRVTEHQHDLPPEHHDPVFGAIEPEEISAGHDDVPSFTWRYETPVPEGGYVTREREVTGPFYHGSRSRRLNEGSEVTIGRKTNDWGDEGPRSKFVHFTTSLPAAAEYARRAGGHVLEVRPTGDDIKGGYVNGEFKTKKPLAVVRRVPPEEIAGHSARTGSKPEVLYSCATDQALPAVAEKAAPLRQLTSAGAAIGSWQPESPQEVAELLTGIPKVIEVIGNGLNRLAARMDGLPVHEDIPAMLRQMAAGCLAAHEDVARLLSSPEGTWKESGPKA